MQSPSIPLFRIGGIISNRRNSIFLSKATRSTLL
ncbi:hypothetical protein [Klebsiella phage vB_KpnS-MUC-5.2]|nr:hypothetical protein [Klebsiella phage vB_KpnS-MUC-5.2]